MVVSYGESNNCGKPMVIHRDKFCDFCLLFLVCSSLHHSDLIFSKHQPFYIEPMLTLYPFFVASCFVQFRCCSCVNLRMSKSILLKIYNLLIKIKIQDTLI